MGCSRSLDDDDVREICGGVGSGAARLRRNVKHQTCFAGRSSASPVSSFNAHPSQCFLTAERPAYVRRQRDIAPRPIGTARDDGCTIESPFFAASVGPLLKSTPLFSISSTTAKSSTTCLAGRASRKVRRCYVDSAPTQCRCVRQMRGLCTASSKADPSTL